MKKIRIYKLFKRYPILIGIVLIGILIGGLLAQRYWAQKQDTQSIITSDDLSRKGTIEQFQNPEELLEYTIAALKNQDLDLVLRACSIDENLLGNPFYAIVDKEQKFGYDMSLPPSADYEEYRPLSSAMLAKYYTEQYDNIQKQFKNKRDVKLIKTGVLYPDLQLSSETLCETAELCSYWGADAAIQMAALLQTSQEDYMISFTVTKYYGYWKIFDFRAEMAEMDNGKFIKPISLEEYNTAVDTTDVLSFMKKLNIEMDGSENVENETQTVKDIKHPEKEILPPNYFIVGESYGKSQKDTIEKFILALQKKNPVEAMSYCKIGDSDKQPKTVTSERIDTQADYAKQISHLYYGLLGEPYFSGERTLKRLDETAESILHRLNPQLIPYMDINTLLKVEDDKASGEEQYIAFYAFNGNCYMSGYTLMKSGENWQITSLSSVENDLDAGEVKEISWDEYQSWIGEK
ncbi:hypothetical protein EDD59_12316 [Muricomes intestini]|uniref:Uncharacterized protein n=1 Tax=Muricomes intestini TaxID=1796634 RepID=A0A4V6NYT8_9FIRM|nr:hypothetical protein [Muricomes intestini]TCS76634.1 hypothetical protein EDD59_12316 [Muricomes intestini]